ncbi:MAG: outer membrane protein transport protein [Vicinamibacteria bacterium]|nr:outer membrane protein transport protein [Vicinamibacteria bacterium]
MDRKGLAVLFAAHVAGLVVTERAIAGALDNSAVGARAIAMGNAFTGIADDASAVHNNPAGLAFLEPNSAYVEAYGWVSFTKFTYGNGGATFKSNEKPIVPGAFGAYGFGRFGVGVGYYVPYGGGGTSYRDFMKTGLELKGMAGFQAITASAAYKIAPNLSVGAGASMYAGLMENKAPQMITVPVTALAEYRNRYSGIAGYGWNAGILYKPTDEFNVGVNVSSPVNVEMTGEERIKIAALGMDATNNSMLELRIPWYYSVGAGYKPVSGLVLGATFCWMNWSDQKEVVITNTDNNMVARITTWYKNSYRLSFGAEYEASRKLTLRAGLKHLPGATDEGKLAPSANDVDLWVPSLGVGYGLTKSIELNLTGFYGGGKKSTQGQETFDQDNPTVVVGVRWRH